MKITSIALLILLTVESLYGAALLSNHPEEAVVLVTASTFSGKKAGNGFVLGDGTLVVTAYHLVFDESEEGQHTMPGLVRVVSPYLGVGCEAFILSADKEIDLAVLRVDWSGHPSLKCADDSSIRAAEKMEILGMPATIGYLPAQPDPSQVFSDTLEHETLSVDFIAERQGIPRFISLSGTGKLGRGWSGSPMLLEGTGCVAGCFVRLHRQAGRSQKTSEGPAISQVIQCVNKTGLSELLEADKSVVVRPKDAMEAYRYFLRTYQYSAADSYELASHELEGLIKIRPESALVYCLAAYNAVEQGENELAEKYYQRAQALKPDGFSQKILYAQYLSDRDPQKAIVMLDELFKSGQSREMCALLMFNILSERGEAQRCVQVLHEALLVNPHNAYLHFNLGACYLQTGKIEDAIVSIEKAVELIPERGPFRGQLAHLLASRGEIDRAEKHFRKLLEIEPNNPVVHFWLAEFLARNRPAQKEEALKEARIALELPSRSGFPKQRVTKFIKDLQASPEEDNSH